MLGLHITGMALSEISNQLAEFINSIPALEKEAALLEVKIMDDANLPDLNELNK